MAVRKDLYFAQIPEWVLYHPDLSDKAIRVYGVLCRYADKEGQSHPSRRTIANHVQKRSLDTVDRALKELVDAAAVTVEQQFADNGDQTSNEYTVHLAPPEGLAARIVHPQPQESGGGEPHGSGGGGLTDRDGGSRTDAATPAARIVHKREPFEVLPPSPQRAGGTSCAIHGITPAPNRRCCGTTPKQIATTAAQAAAARRRAEDQAETERQRILKAAAPGPPSDLRAQVAQARRAAG